MLPQKYSKSGSVSTPPLVLHGDANFASLRHASLGQVHARFSLAFELSELIVRMSVIAGAPPRHHRHMNKHTQPQIVRYALAAALIAGAGCAGPQVASSLPSAPSVAAPSSPFNSNASRSADTARCNAFESTFDELVACRRANGTLQTFSNPIAWRVRYFVRYQEMPCGEAPTEQVAYVFHMVMSDLDNDGDLTAAQRSAIRAAIFDGKTHCKD